MVNAATWGLMITGKLLDDDPGRPTAALRGMLRGGRALMMRTAIAQAMRLMGRQFVLGETIPEAMARATIAWRATQLHLFLRHAGRGRPDMPAAGYARAYAGAIQGIAKAARATWRRAPASRSSCHRCITTEWTHRAAVMDELLPRARELARAAARAGIGFNIDAEEADRLDLSLDVIEALLADPDLEGWTGFGVVVQAYGQAGGRRHRLAHDLAVRHDRRIMVRLVKGLLGRRGRSRPRKRACRASRSSPARRRPI